MGTSLLRQLQDHEGDRVESYQELESLLQGQDGCLPSGVVNRLIAEASRDMRAAQGVRDEVKVAAGDMLLALARSHFHFVMAELQSQLKALGKEPKEPVLLSLGSMAGSYALRCLPFVGVTLPALHAAMSQAGSGRVLRAACCVLEQWSKGVQRCICSPEQGSCPGPRAAQLCDDFYPAFCYMVANWLGCEEEEDKQAVVGAMAAMMGLLLQGKQHREQAWQQLPWLLQQYQEVQDTSRVSKSLSYVLEILEGLGSPVPEGTSLAISSAVHRQLSGVCKEPGPAHRALLSRCFVLQAPACPEETLVFLQSQLSAGSQAGRAAALGLLGALLRADTPAVREKLPRMVEAVQSLSHDPSPQVRRAVLEFIRELLSSGCQSCWPWDVLGHVFTEFQRASCSLVPGWVLPWEDAGALRALCVDILGSLDVSRRGMPKLLWPRLLHYVVQAQYSDLVVPLSRCLRALLERLERGCEEEEEPGAMDSQEEGRSPRECCWVMVAEPSQSRERAVAALQLLQALQSRIHGALEAAWATQIPLLLQQLAGSPETSLGSAGEWEQRVLKLLRASLEHIQDKAWSVNLSRELSQQLGSSAPGSWQKLFLYKALGTALAGCQDLVHVQGQVLRFLQEADLVELPEAQGVVSAVSHAAEGHFHLVLDTVLMFSAAVTRGQLHQTATGWTVRQQLARARATRAALMRICGGIALRAPREQLLSRLDSDILGSILRLFRAQPRDLLLKLALVESIRSVTQAVGNCGSFELASRQEVMCTLLDWIEKEPWDCLAYGVLQVLSELSKLRPPLSREEALSLLAVCCRIVVSSPCKGQVTRRREAARAAENMQSLHRGLLQDLGQLMETLLEAESSSASLEDVLHVLQGWLRSGKEQEKERALWLCARVLGACKECPELMGGGPGKQLGSLVGLLGVLSSDCLAMSRQMAWFCLGSLLQMQAKATQEVPQAEEIRVLCEALSSPDPRAVVQARGTIAKALCRCIPPAQATDFLRAALDSRLPGRAPWPGVPSQWVFTFLVECREGAGQQISRAICEVLFVRRSTEELRQLLPLLLPSLLKCARGTLGMERQLCSRDSWRRPGLEGLDGLEEKPCRVFLLALELLLDKCMEQKWMELLVDKAVWAQLEDPLAHAEGLQILSRG
ncbi:maestro heat-like repeat-containing protein family member 2B [Dryobates pubescens]|uniref:maestro heat-like repeat-containing protein family member 2B n=1 Tax=Dryobates pubescens TaxID=118200 RepID=UPI0023B8D1C0|nr:maestro heat-like repeat-containing protein family member 2B [Dryobates pubescens]